MLLGFDGNKIDYVHREDPKELVERVRSLLAPVSAFDTHHINKINS